MNGQKDRHITSEAFSFQQDIFVALLRSFHAAHSLILQEDGMLTTLTAAVVAPLASKDQFVVCVCNVGDSLAYVYSQKFGVREITQGKICFSLISFVMSTVHCKLLFTDHTHRQE